MTEKERLLEIDKEYSKILYYLGEYKNGNTEAYESIIGTVDALDFAYQRNFFLYYYLTFLLKIVETANNFCLQDEEIGKILALLKNDLIFFKDNNKVLDSYNKQFYQEQELDKLPVAFLLATDLAVTRRYISAALHSVNLYLRSQNNGYAYIPASSISEMSDEYRNNIGNLVKELKYKE